MKTRFAVLLAGGTSHALAPLSSDMFPKQFFRLPGEDESLLQQAARAACELVPAEHVITITTVPYAKRVKQQLQDIAPELARHILVEPHGLGAAASCAVAAHYVARSTDKATLWVLPCDHDRRAPMSLRRLREPGFTLADAGYMVAFGAPALVPDTDFGYLLADNDEVEQYYGAADAAHAQALLATGRAWWNSGMFVLPAGKLLGYLQHLQPELHAASGETLQRAELRSRQWWLNAAAVKELPAQSLDAAIMGRVTGLKMLPLEAGWSDIGTWPRLLAWWQSHAADIPLWDFGNGQALHYAEAWQAMQQG